MAIQGITFDNQQVSAQAHGALFASHSTDGILSGCAISYAVNNISIAAGYLISCGREIRLSTTETISFGQSSGYARVRLRIDLSGTSTEESFNQVSFITDYAAVTSAFDALTQEDINAGGTVYDMLIGIFALSASSAPSPVQVLGESMALASHANEATKLATARTIGITDADSSNAGTGVSFDGTSEKTLKLPSTIKANLEGNVTGSSASCTGNSATATKLATARNIGNASFNGTANITLDNMGAAPKSHTHNASDITGKSSTLNAFTARRIYISTSEPTSSQGEVGDIWIIYS